MRANAHDRIVVVVRLFRRHHVRTGHMVKHEYVLHVLADVRTFIVIVVEVFLSDHHDVGVHLHHERDGLLLPDKVRLDARFALRNFKYLIVGIVRHVVYRSIRMPKQPLDGTLEIFVETAAFRVENNVLVHHVKKALVVGFLAL